MRYYAIGDLHGRYDLLDLALKKIKDKEGSYGPDHRVITLGDYIDRGPESRQIIERLMKEQAIWDGFICLQGNHEEMAVRSISQQLKPGWWMSNGGYTTMESYGNKWMGGSYYLGADVYYSLVPAEHVKWMATLPLFYEAEKQVYVHAGIPQWDMKLPPENKQAHKVRNLEEQMQWMLYHPADHGGWKGKHIVHGHHQFADGPHTWHPGSRGGGRTNLDVWAYKTGRSVIGVFDDTQLTPLEFLEVKIETNS